MSVISTNKTYFQTHFTNQNFYLRKEVLELDSVLELLDVERDDALELLAVDLLEVDLLEVDLLEVDLLEVDLLEVDRLDVQLDVVLDLKNVSLLVLLFVSLVVKEKCQIVIILI
jgi:hypothetical protein